MSTLAHRDLARRQIEFARRYTLILLQDLDDADWFRQPSEGVTHIAWQVAHLAMAEYYFENNSLYYAKTNYEKIINNFPKSSMFNYALYKRSVAAGDHVTLQPTAIDYVVLVK